MIEKRHLGHAGDGSVIDLSAGRLCLFRGFDTTISFFTS